MRGRNVAQIKPGALLDEAGARLLAVREGIKVVLTGSIAPAGSGYTLTVTAIDPAADKPLVTSSEGASSKAEVLQVVGTIASTIRSALGDETPESVRLSAAETVTAASLEALQSYSEGQKLQINSKYDEAIAYYRRAIEQDPKFGRAYSSWAVSAYSLGRRDEADGLYKQAFALMERMTEREKYRVYGTYYLTIARNYQQAIDNYSQLLKLYPADRAARTNLAFAYFSTLDFTRALEENRRAMDIYQGNFKLWSNQALYAMYAGDFKTAEAEASRVLEASPRTYRAYLPRAIAALDRSDSAAAREAYTQMAAIDKQADVAGSDGPCRPADVRRQVSRRRKRAARRHHVWTRRSRIRPPRRRRPWRWPRRWRRRAGPRKRSPPSSRRSRPVATNRSSSPPREPW